MKTTDFTEMNERKDYHASLDKFTDWRNLLCPDIVSPDEILMVLLKAGDYDTAKSWCRHVQFPNEKYLVSTSTVLVKHNKWTNTWGKHISVA